MSEIDPRKITDQDQTIRPVELVGILGRVLTALESSAGLADVHRGAEDDVAITYRRSDGTTWLLQNTRIGVEV